MAGNNFNEIFLVCLVTVAELRLLEAPHHDFFQTVSASSINMKPATTCPESLTNFVAKRGVRRIDTYAETGMVDYKKCSMHKG